MFAPVLQGNSPQAAEGKQTLPNIWVCFTFFFSGGSMLKIWECTKHKTTIYKYVMIKSNISLLINHYIYNSFNALNHLKFCKRSGCFSLDFSMYWSPLKGKATTPLGNTGTGWPEPGRPGSSSARVWSGHIFFFPSKMDQGMVGCWFGLVVWIPGIPLWKEFPPTQANN